MTNDHGILADPTAADINLMERKVRQKVEQLARRDISEISGMGDVTTRDLIPSEDLDSGTDNGWSTSDREWDQSGLTADSFNQTYQIDSDSNAEKKVVGIFGVANLSANPSTTELKFEAPTGGVFERLQVEGLLTDEEVFGLISDPIILRADQDANIEQYVTGTSDQLVFHGAVAEPTGSTLEQSDRFLSDM